MANDPLISPSDQAAIAAAVREAEARTTGEIYCVVAEDSSDYFETPLAWAAGVALLGPALLLMLGAPVALPDLTPDWSAAQTAQAAARQSLLDAILLQLVLFVVTALVVSLDAVRLRLTPRGLKRDRVRREALAHFAAKNLHATRERTGVLIYVSLDEHMAELIADAGIAGQVPPEAWEKPMAALMAGLKRREPSAGFAAAIALCADILAERFPAKPGDNPNELPDAVVLLPRG
ncbi:TPM domain-containing protein [Phenylobacterium sp. J367]|uniref:TPM domain-containing protein n=1 Tax=Phenylobacterium sp. J367 TaxID=2898435 RepID=UPI002150CD7D|nr:TPM domain-containing protein [Phenylobacterium sp. J367]MCR5878565.1 TPM domain-containing protein [Phenylobacterium sp. J367]